MSKETATAMMNTGRGSSVAAIDFELAAQQHDEYVSALSKIVDSVEVRTQQLPLYPLARRRQLRSVVKAFHMTGVAHDFHA